MGQIPVVVGVSNYPDGATLGSHGAKNEEYKGGDDTIEYVVLSGITFQTDKARNDII